MVGVTVGGMARQLAFLAMVGVVIAFVVWTVQRWRYRMGPPAPRRLPSSGAAIEADPEARATLAYGPDRGPGVLRLTASQLVFTADSGRVLVIERLDIAGVTTTRTLPDRDVAQPVLAVTTGADTYFFAVQAPAQWERRLT